MKVIFNPLAVEFQLAPDQASEIHIADPRKLYQSKTVEGALQELGWRVALRLTDAPHDGNTYGRKNGAWTTITAGGGTWGSITGTLSDQTDLQDELNAKEPTITILASTRGGTGVNNAGTLTNASNTTITGGGTVALGGFTLTVPATGTAALLATANVFTALQTVTFSGITEQTVVPALDLVNTTPAINGWMYGQQYSGALHWRGQVWNGSASQDISFRAQVVPLGGATPYGTWRLTASTGGGAYSSPSIMSITSLLGGGVGILRDDPNPGEAKLWVGGNIRAQPNSNVDIYFDIARAANSNLAAFRITPTGTFTSTNQQWWVGLNANQSYLMFAPYYTNPLTPTVVYLVTGEMGVGLTAPLAQLHVVDTTTTTNAVLEVQRIEARVSTASTGGAAGFGVGQGFFAETATDATYQQQGLISTSWIDATNASRKAKISLSAYDTAVRLGFEIEASGSESKIGFHGVAPIVRAVLATGAGATVDNVITALQNLGLVKQA